MPEVLIISDSHGSTKELNAIKERHSPELMIHCGDSELDMDAPELDGFIKVAGNCDMDTRFPEEQTSTVNSLNFFIAHGHLHQVKTNPMVIAYRAEEVGANVVCFGHTHTAGAEKLGQQLLINPGSVLLPRGRTEKTYAIMTWDTLDAICVNFFTVDGNHIEKLSRQISLS
ncbi:metallophosphoesterase [Lentibacillus halophilus]|uniref:Phosphoesterase n=1 Tax=Lentibacillus halophilus TaxID=295065 RepID=A0ABN0ZBF3_9BACI